MWQTVVYAMKLRSLANYDNMELGIKCPVDKPDIVEISGTMAHYYMPKLGMQSKMKQVSLGGSIIRVHQVRDFLPLHEATACTKTVGERWYNKEGSTNRGTTTTW
jgi:hypothetical protein